MGEAVKLPGLGKMPKGWLYAVGAASAAVIGYAWWKKRQSNTSSTSATSSTADSGIDPATGQPYASEYSSTGALGGYPSLGGYYSPATGSYLGAGIGSSTWTVSNNATWFQAAEAYLSNLGYGPATVAAALGKYLSGVHLSADEAAIVQAAIGSQGYPPVNPPPVSVSPPPGQNPPPKPKPHPHPKPHPKPKPHPRPKPGEDHDADDRRRRHR